MHLDQKANYNDCASSSAYSGERSAKRTRTSSDLSSLNYYSDGTQYSSPRYNGYNGAQTMPGFGNHMPLAYNGNFGRPVQSDTMYEKSAWSYLAQERRLAADYANQNPMHRTSYSSYPDAQGMNASYSRDPSMTNSTLPRQDAQSYRGSDRPMLPPPERYLPSTSSPTREQQQPPGFVQDHSREVSSNGKTPSTISQLVSSQSASLPPITTISAPTAASSYAPYRSMNPALSTTPATPAYQSQGAQNVSQSTTYSGASLLSRMPGDRANGYDPRQVSSYSQLPISQNWS